MANTADFLVINKDDAKKISDWFEALQNRHSAAGNGRARRAELRRAAPPYGVLTCQGYHDLAGKLTARLEKERHIVALAIFVSVAAHAAKNMLKTSFAAQLGEKQGGDRPFLSPLRFERLQRAQTPEELHRQLFRAVQIRGEAGVNLPSLADGIFLWMDEWQARQENRAPTLHPLRRNAVRWACEYAQASQNITADEPDTTAMLTTETSTTASDKE
ncbi:type I-E CRISPR-associated protein Cse2/CasB [Pectobacterium versatile]|uniref:type I-E CRISPR-associated protein Cse2/CasB n=1 Tax=Pectobacterium versatile TaxID=2488639 RepID=UPI0015DEFE03|nr:type I-E CRISPR-associated protein Cse2/CasB [Pectobacterium versatile]MBA0163574.1 type I-E CRISPR-associated protein Cse2/CasB [Pectobacterium versatile]MBN3062092.1 type I-E CRISPR-associated protein Cse2/CasB [Pectobacterium versatile]